MLNYSPLLMLPNEVRDRIYDFYLAHEHSDFTDTLRPHNMFFDGVPYSRPLPALMLTCKRVYREMCPAVHGQVTMRVEMRGRVERRIGFAVHGTLRFDRLRRFWLMIPLEHPNWNRWLYFFEKVLYFAPDLEVLVIDWSPRPVLENGWAGRVNLKKEDELFQMIGCLKRLHTIRIHGNISSRWIDKLREAIPRVLHDPSPWWQQP
ncbi:hypothetical protein F5Y09DRAFT_354436 [Xylaria sp. FL1042]|nr:hypothetical protein F5Y09DRAFT_354436 [Xylaria sp. FL1042]